MEFAENAVPEPRLRVTTFGAAGSFNPLRREFAVGATCMYSTNALTSSRSAFSHVVNLA